MPNITTVYDDKRGCGWRQGGGLYLVGGHLSAPCWRLPFPLTVCPCCNGGIKPTRGFGWIDTRPFVARIEGHCYSNYCNVCVFGGGAGVCGIVWVGGKFYERPADLIREANSLKLNGERYGVSRRIPALPKGFEIGKTWVLLAHRDCIPPQGTLGENGTGEFTPGIFAAFKPERIEYVVTGDESEQELVAMEKRGLTLVKVVRLGEHTEIVVEAEDE